MAGARGRWLVMVDSDDELVTDALVRLRDLIDGLAPGVRIIRYRHRLDDGTISPGVIPAGITDYAGRLRWLEAVTAASAHTDAGHCINREVFATTGYDPERRGAVESVWELDLARRERSLWTEDVLGLVHDDAPNRSTQSTGGRRLAAHLRTQAHDQLWVWETLLARHGDGLARLAPHYHRWVLQSAATEAFLCGARRRGIGHAAAAARAGARPSKLAATVLLGLMGPDALAATKVAGRRWRARRR